MLCSLDLTTLSSELVEIILRVVPSDAEIKLYRGYEADGKPVEVLADEDKFMLSVSCCYLFDFASSHLLIAESWFFCYSLSEWVNVSSGTGSPGLCRTKSTGL